MQDLEIKIKVTLCQMDELSAEDQALVGQAIEATRHSYAAYSHFHVGAAVRLQDGRVVIGANQENAAFPSGLCAERRPSLRPRPTIPTSRSWRWPSPRATPWD